MLYLPVIIEEVSSENIVYFGRPRDSARCLLGCHDVYHCQACDSNHGLVSPVLWVIQVLVLMWHRLSSALLQYLCAVPKQLGHLILDLTVWTRQTGFMFRWSTAPVMISACWLESLHVGSDRQGGDQLHKICIPIPGTSQPDEDLICTFSSSFNGSIP